MARLNLDSEAKILKEMSLPPFFLIPFPNTVLILQGSLKEALL